MAFELVEGPIDFRDKGGAISWPVVLVQQPQIDTKLLLVAVRGHREEIQVSNAELPRRERCGHLENPVATVEEESFEVRRKVALLPQSAGYGSA